MAKGKLFSVLVTGGAGYIGAHACKALKNRGFEPLAFDNLVYGHKEDVQWGPFFEGDLLDRSKIDEAIRKFSPFAVMHFAGFAYVGESVTNPGKYYRNNVAGSLNLLEAMRDHGIKYLIFSSSCATYGVPNILPIPESHAKSPINPYGETKLIVERMMSGFENAHGIKYLALRYFNAAGADPEAQIGERHDPETHLIPLVIDAALGRRPDVKVFGNDFGTPDGTCIRDYIHVSDLADAHLLGLEYLQKTPKFSALNLGTGKGFSVKEVIATVEKVTKLKVPFIIGNRRAGDPPELVGNCGLAKGELGWSPRFQDLETIILHAFQHRKKLGS